MRGEPETTLTLAMAADFLALGQDHDAVLVMLGVDDLISPWPR